MAYEKSCVSHTKRIRLHIDSRGGNMVRNNLIPTDGSDYGKTAIAFGIYSAGKLEAQLIGLHVIDVRLLQGPVFTDISGSIDIPPYQEFFPAIESSLDAKAESIFKEFRLHGHPE
jgi:hypothetical protein